MNRSPYLSPLGRAADMDVGGAADLQTDIMRFMAILALCLVAIFALVQSIPLQPIEKPTPVRPEPSVVAPAPQPLPQPARRPEPRESVKTVVAPASPPPVENIQQPTPAPKPPVPVAESAPEPEGFTLRFASDAALTRLVARNEIGLYAITSDRALRMSLNGGSPGFWPASAPREFHEMDPATVPADVTAALRRAGTLGLNPEVKWGVTLPPTMRRQLDRYLREHRGGELVIETTGNLRLEN